MKTIIKFIVQFLLTLWQLPQCLVGAVLALYYRGEVTRYTLQGVYSAWVFCSPKQENGISLGCFVILPKRPDYESIWHELGHCIQSLLLGWLYLPVIGLPSLIHAVFHKGGNYRHFFTEKWADKIQAKYQFE